MRETTGENIIELLHRVHDPGLHGINVSREVMHEVVLWRERMHPMYEATHPVTDREVAGPRT